METSKSYLRARKSDKAWMNTSKFIFAMWLGIIGEQIIRLIIT